MHNLSGVFWVFLVIFCPCCVSTEEVCRVTTGCRNPTPERFKGKVFLVTGASSGIGEVVAKHLAADGAHVVLAARRLEKLEKVKDEIEASGGVASTAKMDVLNYDNVEQVINETVTKHGALDGAFNNAGGEGGGAVGTVASQSVEDFRKNFDLNFFGTYHPMKAELQVMQQQGSGSIVNNLSILGKAPMAGQAAYSAAKRAIFSLQDSASLEAAAMGVRVNSVSPAFTYPSEALDNFLKAMPEIEPALRTPQGRLVHAAEVYESVAFLLDERVSSSITGIDMPVSGGKAVPAIKLAL